MSAKSYTQRMAGYCRKHRKGPLDVWYDCQECMLNDDKGNWQRLPIPVILQLISQEDAESWLRWWHS